MRATGDPLRVTELVKRLGSRFSMHLPTKHLGSLLDWGRTYLSHYYTNEPSRMHEWLARELDDNFPKRGQRMVAIGPRGGAKSVLCTLTYVLKQIVEAREPYVMIVSDTESQAVEHLNSIKAELEDNEALRSAYPHAVGPGPKWTETYIILRNGPAVHAVGTGSKIRGRRRRQNRPTLIVLDDPENDSHCESQLQRGKMHTWFNQTLLNMGDQRTNVLGVGTAIHQESILMASLNRPGWTTRRVDRRPAPFKAIERWPTNVELWDRWDRIYARPDDPGADKKARLFYRRHYDEMNAGVKLLWPDRETLYDLMCERAQIGRVAFEHEKQSNPVNPESAEWPEEYFSHEDFWCDELPADLVIRGMALDPSKGKDAKRFDYSAFAIGGVDAAGVAWVDFDLARRSTDRIVMDGVDLYRKYHPDCFGIEVNQFQSLLAEDFRQEFQAQAIEPKIIEIDNVVKKIVRIRRLSPLLSQRRLRVVRSPGSKIAVAQAKEFPNGDHDDGPDALEMLLRMLFRALEEFPNREKVVGHIR